MSYNINVQIEYGRVPERPKGADCKSVVTDYDGSNPSPSTKQKDSYGCLFAWSNNGMDSKGGSE